MAVTNNSQFNNSQSLPLSSNFLLEVSKFILQQQSQNLPDISRVHIILPNNLATQQLSGLLLRQAKNLGHDALLGPNISTMQQWLSRYAENLNGELISYEKKLLILTNEIKKYAWLYMPGDPWLLSENLLHLFEQLYNKEINLPDNEQSFVDFLKHAYLIKEVDFEPLNKEAKLIYTLWRAWNKQLNDEKLYDYSMYYSLLLEKSLDLLDPEDYIYLAGHLKFTKAETQWINKLSNDNKICVLIYGEEIDNNLIPALGLNPNYNAVNLNFNESNCNDSALSKFYNACYEESDSPITERAKRLNSEVPNSPLAGKCSVVSVKNAEQHAQVIAISVKQSILDNHNNIAVITENRKLARRVRALLERDNIILNDVGGWALSTTTAATTIENLILCFEKDFPYSVFLDLLKSPFIKFDEFKFKKKVILQKFEQFLIYDRNIKGGIKRYINSITNKTLPENQGGLLISDHIIKFLSSFAQEYDKFRYIIKQNQTIKSGLIDLLINSLEVLGIKPLLENDAAGTQIIDLFKNIKKALLNSDSMLVWSDLRAWLARAMEYNFFSPPSAQKGVYLLSLDQSHILNFDKAILAAADEHHLPGNRPHNYPFFNDTVNQSLGLETWLDFKNEQAYKFRSLLERCPNILISWQCEENGELIAASPWLSAIMNFHSICYQQNIEDSSLLEIAAVYVSKSLSVTISLPPPPSQPAPACPVNLFSKEVSVSAYQRLVDCPYRFYAHDLLKLKANEDVKEALKKSDFGNKIHFCLQAFFSNIEKLPGPITSPLSQEHYADACELLSEISKIIFSDDIKENFQNRSWLNNWLNTIPAYIDWEINHAEGWHVSKTEFNVEKNIGKITLYGRIDRVDEKKSLKRLIDYKTGSISSKDAIMTGEDVQLSSYAMILENTENINYLDLSNQTKVNNKNHISGEDLEELTHQLRQRTEIIFEMLETNYPLPARPDKNACSFCEYYGLCRHQSWHNTKTNVMP